MAAINQRIPNFLGGVSQQPDTIKFPGQLRVCDNALPDVTFGLTKRPPGEFVKKLDNVTSGGYYYNIIRQKDAKYLIQITPGQGANSIKAWNLKTGDAVTVTDSSGGMAYLNGATSPYAVQTIQDTTIIGNPTIPTAKSGNTGGLLDSGNYAFARCDTIAYNTEYVLWQGDTEPAPRKFRRVTSVKVEVRGGFGPVGSGDGEGQTFDTFPRADGEHGDAGYTDTPDSNNDNANTDPVAQYQQSFAGGKGFGGELTTVPSDVTQANAPNDSGFHTVKTYKSAAGYVTLNGHSYIYQQEKTWDSDIGADDDDANVGGRQASNFLGYVARYKTRYTAAVTLDYGGRYDGEGSNKLEKGDYIDYVEIQGKNESGNAQSVGLFIRCNGYEEFESFEDVSSIAYYRSPENPDEGNLSMTHILKGLKDSMSNVSNVNATIVGNGLYLEGSNAPKVRFLGGTVNEGMTVFSRSTTDISRLPAQCKKGYVVRIANSENTDADNYYLKFVTDSDAEVGPGKWEECARPNGLNFGDDDDTQDAGFDITKMPHKLVSSVNAAGQITGFEFSAITVGDGAVQWSNREVGDMKTNPMPSFLDKKISKIFFHRNRLAFVADEQIVLSQPGDYFNFFSVSAITNTDDNPIDIGMSDIRPAYIRHVLPVQKGIMLFSDTAQFLLFTESDIYSSKTVRLKKMSDYECDASIEPVDLGTTVMWASTVGPYTRAFEAAVIDDGSPPKVIEQTRVIPELIPSDVTISACSPAVGLVTYGKKGDNSLYIYKYFDGADNQRAQSAWFTWTLTGELQHAAYTAGNLYTVTKTNNEYILSRHEFVTNRVDAAGANRAYRLGPVDPSKLNTSRWFEACLDYMEVKVNTDFTYDADDKYSHITLPHTPSDASYNNEEIFAVVLDGDNAGYVIKAQPKTSSTETILSDGTTAKFKADLKTNNSDGTTYRIAIGYRYETTIEFPTFYPSLGDARDLNGDLRISGVNFELGVSGPMEFNLSSIYSDISDYTLYESGMTIGTGQYSEPPAVLNKSVRVPIQRKNDKYKLQLKIPDPFSTSLLSASWDGRYNTRRHVRK